MSGGGCRHTWVKLVIKTRRGTGEGRRGARLLRGGGGGGGGGDGGG